MIVDNKNLMLNKQFLIAEVGLAHEGSLGIAQSFAKIAKLNGADAIKFQHHNYEYENLRYFDLLKL